MECGPFLWLIVLDGVDSVNRAERRLKTNQESVPLVSGLDLSKEKLGLNVIVGERTERHCRCVSIDGKQRTKSIEIESKNEIKIKLKMREKEGEFEYFSNWPPM